MNWKVRLVLLFSRLQNPVNEAVGVDIASMRELSDRSAGLGTLLFDKHVPIAYTADTVAYGIPIRIYRNSDRYNLPVIVYYHGGGFVLYGIHSHDNVCRRLCMMNDCIVVSVGYRLAPEHTFPAAHEDAFTAIRWTLAHIAEYGGDPVDIVLAGDSAGGNLAACMAHRCRRECIPIRAQVLVYPWIDGRLANPSIQQNGTGYMLTYPTMLWFQKQYTPRIEDRCVPSVSPCFEPDCRGLPPAFILTAQYDPLIDDGYLYYQQLTVQGVTTRYCEYQGLFHGFINLPAISPSAMTAYDDIRDFLRAVWDAADTKAVRSFT